MFSGDGSYINHIYITKDHANYSPLKCALPNTTLSDWQWVDPNGNPLSCNTNPLYCDKTTNPASISLYRPNGRTTFTEAVPNNNPNNKFYKCCLHTNCSDPTTNMITVNIYSKLYFIVLVHTVTCYWSTVVHVEIIAHNVIELPSDMTPTLWHNKWGEVVRMWWH